MGGNLWEFVKRAGDVYVGVCLGYEDDFLSSCFAAGYYTPALLTVIIIGLTISHFEVFYWLLTMVLFIDFPLNYGLRVLIGPSNNIQPLICPIDNEQMPASAVQLIIALWVVGFAFSEILFQHPVSNQKLAFFVAVTTFVIYTPIYLAFNSTAQILAGAGVGFIEGVLYVWFINFLHKRRVVALIVRFTGLTMLGKPIDTIIDSKNPTIHLSEPFDTLNVIVGA